MKIVVISGSSVNNGSSILLANQFIEGALEAGNDAFHFNAALEKVESCLHCDYCMMGNRPCIHGDSMNKLNPELIRAELVVFVTPLYYFGISDQLKTIIDRFYANNIKLMRNRKKVIIIALAQDEREWTMEELKGQFKTLFIYLNWEDVGALLATENGLRSDINLLGNPEQVYMIGRNLKFILQSTEKSVSS